MTEGAVKMRFTRGLDRAAARARPASGWSADGRTHPSRRRGAGAARRRARAASRSRTPSRRRRRARRRVRPVAARRRGRRSSCAAAALAFAFWSGGGSSGISGNTAYAASVAARASWTIEVRVTGPGHVALRYDRRAGSADARPARAGRSASPSAEPAARGERRSLRRCAAASAPTSARRVSLLVEYPPLAKAGKLDDVSPLPRAAGTALALGALPLGARLRRRGRTAARGVLTPLAVGAARIGHLGARSWTFSSTS